MSQEKPKCSYRRYALLLSLFLIILTLGSILWLITHDSHDTLLYAEIYQQGKLLQTIPLSTVTESYSFSVEDDDGNENIIAVRPGSIGITSATCPDKLCVHQGFIENSLLPITCLPNRLVIQIREEKLREQFKDSEPDIIAY